MNLDDLVGSGIGLDIKKIKHCIKVTQSQNVTIPEAGKWLLLIQGAGSSGAAISSSSTDDACALGGGAGELLLKEVDFTLNEEVPVLIGAGGASVSAVNGTGTNGNNGGDTTVSGFTAVGAIGGTFAYGATTLTPTASQNVCGVDGVNSFTAPKSPYSYTIAKALGIVETLPEYGSNYYRDGSGEHVMVTGGEPSIFSSGTDAGADSVSARFGAGSGGAGYDGSTRSSGNAGDGVVFFIKL